MILIRVSYRTKPGYRDDFVKALLDEDIAGRTRKEPGNLEYTFSVPIGTTDAVCLLERWESAEALVPHPRQPHFLRLQEIKERYVADTTVTRCEITPL